MMLYNSFHISQAIDIATLPDGSYNSFLFLPDQHSSLASRPEYAIQCANDNTWESTTGYNKLLQTVTKPATSVKMTAHTKIAIHPNPLHGSMLITMPVALSEATLIITNTSGQVVMVKKDLNGNSFEVNEITLPSGVYVIKIFSKDNAFIYSDKLVIAGF